MLALFPLLRLSSLALIRTLILTLLLLLTSVGIYPARASEWATILTYNRFGEDGDPYNTIRLDQFEAHLAEITRGGYTVMPLGEIIAALRNRQPLPDRTLAITIDDSHGSIWTEAWPRLKRAGLPFTIFLATETIDRGASGYMTWDQLRELRDAGVAFGNLTAAHPHLPVQTPNRIAREIEQANRRIMEELGIKPDLFAYPYGEWSREVRRAVIAAGFRAAFGQQSGIAYAAQDYFTLPRFPMSEAAGNLGRFRLAIEALPLKITELTPDEPMLSQNPPSIGFTVVEPFVDLNRLACFTSHLSGPVDIERLGERRIEIRLSQPFPPGRGRVNCTLPGPNGRWHWLGLQFYQPMDR